MPTNAFALYENQWNSFSSEEEGEKASRRDEVSNNKPSFSVEVFMDELKTLLRSERVDPSGELATSILSRISIDQYKDLDVDIVSATLPELCRNLEQMFCKQGGVLQSLLRVTKDSELWRLVQRVRERMEQLKDERLTMRCGEKCPFVWDNVHSQCGTLRAARHHAATTGPGRHHVAHKQGFVGIQLREVLSRRRSYL